MEAVRRRMTHENVPVEGYRILQASYRCSLSLYLQEAHGIVGDQGTQETIDALGALGTGEALDLKDRIERNMRRIEEADRLIGEG